MIAFLRFLFVIPIGFVAGCFAAAFALLWPFLDLGPGTFDNPVITLELFFGFMAQTAQIGSAVLVPWAIFMGLSEIFALSSIVLHIVAGAAGGFALARSWYGESVPSAILTAMVVGGIAFLMVYWVVAGRRAGHWRAPSMANDIPRSNSSRSDE